jgi:hypothetical protein
MNVCICLREHFDANARDLRISAGVMEYESQLVDFTCSSF